MLASPGETGRTCHPHERDSFESESAAMVTLGHVVVRVLSTLNASSQLVMSVFKTLYGTKSDQITFDNFFRVTENKQNFLLSEEGNCAWLQDLLWTNPC